jgi:ribosomal subunit interface protein
MEIKFFTQKMELPPEAKDYVEEKLEKIVKVAGYSKSDIRGIHVDLSRNPSHENAAELIRLEVNVDFLTGQRVMQAAERAETVQKAVDLVEDDLIRQLRKMKTGKKARRIKIGRLFKKLLNSAPAEEEEQE